MTLLDIFIYIWLSMAAIKFIIIMATIIHTFFSIISKSEPKPTRNFILIAKNSILIIMNIFLIIIAIAIMWPFILFVEGVGFFIFPNDYIKETITTYFNNKEEH
jgi:hypothetical protein